ncbi:MAG: hypothetical protein DRP01_02535 [Archaeoglobales archaeon]|nr:MAG: hypothetical protein DRP01_02535 [Archaeoglobales archaeon]
MDRPGLKAQAEVLIYEHRGARKVLIHRQKLNTFTYNFIKMIYGMTYSLSMGANVSVALTNLMGDSIEVMFQGPWNPGGGVYLAEETSDYDLPCILRIGSSSTPESRSDYHLGDEKMNAEANVAIADDKVKISASFTPSTDITVREVGYSKAFREKSTGGRDDFLMLRGVISERTFSAGTTYTVEIRISFT